MTERILLLDESRGIYIPYKFFHNYDLRRWGLDPKDYGELSSVDNDNYWSTWDDLLANAKYTDEFGRSYYLEQDGDLFAVLIDD
jgi:hypothetical protein